MAGFRFAYRLPCGPMLAKDHPLARRLNLAWGKGSEDGWMAQAEPTGGCFAVWPQGGDKVAPEHFGPPRTCPDGLLYYPSLVKPSGEDLIRSERGRPPGGWLELYDGDSLYVPLALATPRKLLLRQTGFQFGDYATELGRLGHEIYDLWATKKAGGLADDDPRLLRIVFLTLQAGYHVTEEMIEDQLPFGLTDLDINPMLHMMFGYDPKSSGAEPAPSPSAPDPTPTSP